MKTWKVIPIKYGSIDLDYSNMTNYKNKGVQITVPIWGAAITDGNTKIIVDTGVRDAAEYKAAEPGFSQQEDEITENAIKSIMGWDCLDVDIVINTHLHVDHAGCNYLFKNAKFYVQKTEWEAAHNPLIPEKPFYLVKDFDKTAVKYFQWNFLEGDSDILEGISVITTPGHTRGHQSVLVNIEEGVLCITGDISNIADNVNENLEPNIIVDVPGTYESIKRVRQFADYMLPGHDPNIISGKSEFIKVVDYEN
ncbi:MAG: N-acyl homoserine lactonase family protein [Clostridiaceae bacterium]|nr:N-acyl homoserine lactonase family protein [Clostridiaceae bacterium]